MTNLIAATVLPVLQARQAQTTPSNGSSLYDDWSTQLVAQAEKSWVVSGTSVLAAWACAFVGSLLIVLLFSLVRRKYDLIYLPRYLYLIQQEPQSRRERGGGIWRAHVPFSNPATAQRVQRRVEEQGHAGKRAKTMDLMKLYGDEIKEGFWVWLLPAWHDFKVELNLLNRRQAKTRDQRLLENLGLDAFTFLQFLRLLRWLFALITVFIAAPLICANYFINTRTEYGSTSVDRAQGVDGTAGGRNNMTSVIGDLQLFTAANITGNGLWIHISAEVAVTMIVILQVIVYSRRHERVIENWSDMNASEIAFKTILVTGLEIPAKVGTKRLLVDDALAMIKKRLGVPDDDVAITIKQEGMSSLAKLIKFWNEVESQRVGDKIQNVVDNKDHKPSAWWAWCVGLVTGSSWQTVGTVVQAGLAKYNATVEKQEQAIRNENRGHVHSDITAAFVTWKTAREAHERLRELKARKSKLGFKVQRSPRYGCIEWRNLEKDPSTIRKHRISGSIARWLITILNSIPVMIIMVLANLDALIEANDRLREMRRSSQLWNAIFTALAGVAPATLSALFFMALPYLMRFLSRWQGSLSWGELDKDVIRQMFVFLLISKFVVFALLGIGYDTYLTIADQVRVNDWRTIFESLGDVPAKITKAYISQSSYWLSFFPIKCAVCCLQLLQLPRCLIKFYELWIVPKAQTVDRGEQVNRPAEFEYAIEYTNVVFGLVVALVYTPLAPIVAICGAAYFWTASIVYQNQLTFVEQGRETDGKVWRVVINRLLAALCFMQVLMVLTVVLKTGPFQTSEVPLGTRLAPTICAILPLLATVWLAYHVSTYRTAADIVSTRDVKDLHSKKGGSPQRFELDILQLDAIKKITLFRGDVEKVVEMTQDKASGVPPAVGDLMPQVSWMRRRLGLDGPANEGEKGRKKRAATEKNRMVNGMRSLDPEPERTTTVPDTTAIDLAGGGTIQSRADTMTREAEMRGGVEDLGMDRW